jgi:tetratricopeptide (TPR) repeat protein
MDNRSASRVNSRNPEDCEIQASLSGFSSDKISLSGRVAGGENVDVGRILLHRLANVEGMTLSATTAAAPRDARKAYERGQQQEQRGELAEAQKSFETAVQKYPKFAAAWAELGNVQRQQNDIAGARKSFEASIAADDKYIHPYRGLMMLALREQKWTEVIATSEKIIALNGINFPEAWFINGLGNFFSKNYVNAEKSARRGLEIDSVHQIPKLEYLLGMALMKTNQFEEAATHFQNYLHLVKTPNDIAEAQKQLDEVARLSSARAPVNAQSK